MVKTLVHSCTCCGNASSYDKQSLKASTYNINGCDVVLCCPCEDDLLVKLAKGRGIIIKLGDGGEVDSAVLKNKHGLYKEPISVPVYYALPFPDSKKILLDIETMREEFDFKLEKLNSEINKRNKKIK